MQADASPALPGQVQAGPVVALWRYPVKSKMGEELNCSGVTGRGLLGDRQFAVADRSTGKVGGAKNPGKRGNFFGFRAAYAEPPQTGARISPVRITLPDGTVVTSGQADLEQILSRVSGRDVLRHRRRAPADHRDDQSSPGSVSGGTLRSPALPPQRRRIDRAGGSRPRRERLDRRQRPAGHHPALPRCVMITLPQGDLPEDSGIPRTAAQHNAVNVGVYASVISGGTIHRGDPVTLT